MYQSRKILAENLTFLRKKYDMTQEQFAEKCEISTTETSKIERGLVSPSLDTLDKIAKGFQLESKDLLSRSLHTHLSTPTAAELEETIYSRIRQYPEKERQILYHSFLMTIEAYAKRKGGSSSK